MLRLIIVISAVICWHLSFASTNKNENQNIKLTQGFVIPFNFTSNQPKSQIKSCSLYFNGQIHKATYELSVKWGSEYRHALALPDKYSLVSIKCLKNSWSFSHNSVGTFEVFKNKQSLLSPFEVIFDQDDSLTVFYGVNNQNQATLNNVFEKLEPIIKSNLVSGYNGSVINKEILEHKIDLDYSFNSHNQRPVNAGVFRDLKINECVKLESQKNPIMFGEYEVNLDLAHSNHHKIKIDTATISKESKECILSKIKKFNFAKYNIKSGRIKL